jgi:hypothetical protein
MSPNPDEPPGGLKVETLDLSRVVQGKVLVDRALMKPSRKGSPARLCCSLSGWLAHGRIGQSACHWEQDYAHQR